MSNEETALAGRFGQFVRERHAAPSSSSAPEIDYPLAQDTRELIAHHLIPLALLARSDGDYAASEQTIMANHAAAILSKSGHALNDTDKAKLGSYIAGFRPTLMQLDPSLHRLDHETTENKIAFLDASRALVNADGKIDPAEARLMDELKLEFAKA
jgi:hypothetical protein